MSLPQPLASKIKSIPMDPLALANNVELAYMLSFSNYSLPSDPVQCSPKESYHSPLETYNFVNFDEQTYDSLYAETKKNYELKNTTTVKSIRNSFKQFFTRVSAMTYSAALKKDELLSAPSTSSLKIPTFETQFKIDQMKGNNPNDWPRNLQQFHEQLSKLPWNAFACQPELYFEDFFRGTFKALNNSIQKYKTSENKAGAQKQIFFIIQIIIMTSMRTNNQTFILQKMQIIKGLEIENILAEKDLLALVRKLQQIFQEIIDKVPVTQEQEYHAPKKLWEKGSAFMIMKKIHFQRQNGLNYFSVTNDGTYLYIYISSINGGMYKVGTGKNSSTAGKIYLQKQIMLPVGSKLEEVNWVYCRGKLYLKIGSREPNSIEVINPENFKTEQIIQLKCPSIFGHQSLVNLNRNSILMTDGKSLYFLGKQLKIKQNKEQKKEEQPKQVPEQQQKVKKKKTKKPKAQQNQAQSQKPNPQQIEKVLQFVLLQFDFNQEDEEFQCQEKLIEDLYTSFNGYFTTKQCKKALRMSENDLSDAAQWLVDQGQKQRTTKTLYPSNKVIISEADITSNFSEKNLKGSNQITTKQGSLLHVQNVHQSIWTMDEQQITCYSENGFKIFSKSSLDSHSINQCSSLTTTHLKTLEGKIQRNPQYTINYDPYNRIFYTFTWPTDGGHYFPTAVLIGSDYKQAVELSHQKKTSLSQIDPRNFSDLQRWMLVKMNMLDNSHCPEQGRVNDYLWFYAQKIIQINKQINSNTESDKKKLTNKRAKLLTKMNKVNEHFQIFQNNKKEFDKNGKVTIEIKLVPPFGSDGSAQNLLIIRNSFAKNLEHDDIYDFIFCLEGWLLNSPKITNNKSRQILSNIRNELTSLKPRLTQNSQTKLNSLLITHFFDFFLTRAEQQQFIMSLENKELKKFVEAYQVSRFKAKKSIIYDIKSKDNIVQKYDSKSKFEDIFLTVSNIPLKEVYENKTIGNLMIDSIQLDRKQKSSFYRYLEKQILESSDGVKLMEHLFLEAFRAIVKNRTFLQYKSELEKLFIDTFGVFQKVVSQSNLNTLKRLTQPLNEFLQIYFASLCSLTPCSELIQIFQKILQQLQKKEIVSLFSFVEDLQFEGISQTFEKIYETPHPIERGKNQNFPPFRNQEAALIYAQFDKRCQSDPNHDTLSIQITHQNSPVGNSINCNDGVFTTNLRLTGKLDSGKPYLIMGNSVNVDFVSSGHAKDAKSFGRFGFKFGLRPIFAGKIKYKKNGVEKIEKVFGIKSQFQKYVNTLKLLTIVLSNSIQNILSKEREEQHNLELNKFLMGKIFREGYQQEPNYPKSIIFQPESSIFQNLCGEKKLRDGRFLIMKSLHSDNVAKQKQKKQPVNTSAKFEQVTEQNIWNVEGIPNYIRSYVEKIKNFNGDFVDVFLQARELARPQGRYALQMRKMGFTEEIKKFWLQGEAILFLTVLKHSGLLHLNLKFSIEYIKANLKAFQEARNGIYEALLSRIQSERQWRDLIQTFEGQKQVKQSQIKKEKTEEPSKVEKIGGVQIKKKGMPTKTIKLDNKNKNTAAKVEKKIEAKQEEDPKKDAQKRRKQAQKTIRERLTQDYMVKQICSLKKIDYIEKQTYQNVTRILSRIQKDITQNKKQVKSVYLDPMSQLIQSCIFLLKMKSPSTKQTIGQEQNLQPESIFRSYSQDQRHVNINKVNVFREWLENWKKWKQFKKEGKVQLKFPVSEIIDFVKSCLSLELFKNQIDFRSKISQNRIKFYEYNNNLLKIVSNSFLSKYVIGAGIVNIKNSFNTGLESVSSSKILELSDKYRQYSTNLKSEEQRKFKQFPLKLKDIQSLVNTEVDGALEKIKLASLHLYLIQSENLEIDLDIPLYFIPLKFLSNTNQELIFIASLIAQKSFLSQHNLDEIISKIWRQIGNNTLSCKRWRDYFFIERIMFLMRKLQHHCRQKLQVSEKQKVAEVLFHMIYFLQIPLICKICLRILNMLKIILKRDIGTPLSKKYHVITFENELKYEQLKFQNKEQFNNIDLIAIKCYNIFKGDFRNEIKDKMLEPFKQVLQEEADKQNTFTIILNMNQEEDIVWMVTVLYYLEQIQKTVNSIKDWEQYQGKKNKKKDHHKQKEVKQVVPPQEVQQSIEKSTKKQPQQRLLQNIPNNISKVSDQIEANLPVGWYFNYCNIYNDYLSKSPGSINLSMQNTPNLAQKKGKNANQAANTNTLKKQWNPVQFLKLYKKFEDLTSKPLEQPKQQESQQIKAEFIKAKNFISRIRKHSSQVSIIYSNLSQNGFYVFREEVTKQKCQVICQLFSLGGQNKLKAIPCEFVTKDYATKLSPAFIMPAKKSQLKITCIKSDQYRKFNDIINAPSNVQVKVENNPILFYTTLGQTQFAFEDKCHLPYEEFPEIESNQENEKIQFSKFFNESGFSKMKKRQDEVYLKSYPNLRYFLSQGGLQSGLSNCVLAPSFDSSLSAQKSNVEHIFSAPTKHEIIDDPEQLLEKTINLMKNEFQQIKNKDDIIPFLLLSCYLQRLSDQDLNFVSTNLLKQFGEKLSKFIKGFKADHSIQKYRQKIQVLITKSLDSENSSLSHFRLFRFDEENLNETLQSFIDHEKLKNALRQEKKQATQETISSHQIQKSNYQLQTHTPIPEENKLLKYWQKNILPKIYEFVKSSLKQMQIDDFFEQMRIPLRKNDQLEAKQIAYVICDNKLPQGAVLPDANHNWNSLTLQDVTVGQDVILRLSKSKHESSSPLMWSQSQQHRVAQIMFIDHKSFSALVRHRLTQYGIFLYSWVPINSLEKVEESIAHYSLQTIYSQLQSCLKGIIFNFGKTCITSITKKIKIEMDQLLEYTIVDMLRDNPISGWNQKRNKSLKQAIKLQLREGKSNLIEIIENKFCTFESYDIDLYSESIISLNKFQNCLGLVVSFKKTSTLIWYSGIKFFADQFGFKEIANICSGKSNLNELQPLEFKNPNVYCKYFASKQSLMAYEQNRYQQNQIGATVYSIDSAWTICTYLANIIGQIAAEQNKYEDLLTRINIVFMKWLQKRQFLYLSTQLCRIITKNTLRIRKIYSQKQKTLTLELLGTSEEQLKSLLEWANSLKEQQDKDMLVLYSPLLQNLIQLIASIVNAVEKATQVALNLPAYVQEVVKLIQMITEIEKNLDGKKSKKQVISNETQWERILLVQNIPSYINEKQFTSKIKQILLKNNGKVLTPLFDIFYQKNQAVILVDSWDITELIEEEVIEKIQQEEEQKEPEQEEGGLLMEWQCQVCTFINPIASPNCGMCDSPAPAPKAEAVFEKVQTKDVNQTQMKLRQKQMKRFENIKNQIKQFIKECWTKQCSRIDTIKKEEEKIKEQKKKKKSKVMETEEKTIEKPLEPIIELSSGSPILQNKIIQEFLKKRFEKLPSNITKKIPNKQNMTYLTLFKDLAKLGYDLWGDNISSEQPSLLKFQYLSELMQYIQDEICKGSSSVLSYNQSSIRMINQIALFKDEEEEPINFIAQNNIGVKTKYKRLSEQQSYNIRYSWRIIKDLNLSASKCLQFINMKLLSSEEGKIVKSTHTIGANLKCLRQLIMGALKLQLFQKITQKTSTLLQSQQIPKINLQRLKIKQERDTNHSQKLISSKDKDNYLFTKSHEQLQKISSINLRPFKPKGAAQPFLSFVVIFKGELVQGEAGPYRQFFTDITNQLNPEFGLGMFIKTPNNVHKTGEGRSKWTINPKANSTYYLSLFFFLGRLMGCCIRTGCHLPLDLANFCWKLIADENIKDMDHQEIDTKFIEQNKFLIQCPSESTFDAMEEIVGQPVTWIYTTIDGQQHELKPNGRSERVKYSERVQYIELTKKKRAEEISLQVEKIRQGLNQMIPQSFLNYISGQELKTMVCGAPKVDVQLLRKHTKYAAGLNQQSPIIKYFWQFMKQISEEQRFKLIRFCWGQERLPLNSQEFERNGVRFMIKPMLNNQKPDQALPKADTCFFNIELPNYSSKQIMKQRILLAINLDNVSINADRNPLPDENPLMGNPDYDDEVDGQDDEEGGGG